MTPGTGGLAASQRELLEHWLPGASVTADHSWGLIGTTVLELAHAEARYIIKAGDERDHHVAREIHAHRHWLGPWTSRQRAPLLTHAAVQSKILVTRYLEGELVQGSEHEWQAQTYRQAGELLAVMHGQASFEDDEYEAVSQDKAVRWLDAEHRIAPEVAARLRTEISSWSTSPVTVVPTHGDWQPRNWLIHHGEVRVIDFGRAALRPAITDFARLAVQQFRERPELEAAFLEGYGGDPRQSEAWYRNRICEAIGTAVWAYQVGDTAFEQQGHRMIAEAMA